MSTSKNLNEVYTPIADFIVVEFIVPDKTKGGILLTDSAKEEYSKNMAWKVVAIGKEVKHAKVGDFVLVGPNARPIGVPLLHEKEDTVQHVQLREYEIMGFVNETFLKENAKAKPTPILE
jgi:co-chaperonin GroES (HSP10)